jgi:hypothetical protein
LTMLFALEREDRKGDLIASACLLVALAFSSLGIPFIAAAAADVLLRHRERGVWRRVAIFAVPVLLFAAWYVGWGSDAESHVSLRNVLAAPRFVADLVAFGVAGMAGLGTSPYGGEPSPVWGYPLVIGLLVALGLRARQGPLPTAFWVVGAAAAANWFLTAANQFPGRAPITSRYVYATAIFVILMAANALVGYRWGRRALTVAALVTLTAISVNLVVLKDGANFFRDESVIARADLAAIEIARATVPADLRLSPEIAGTPSLIDVTAGEYLEAIDEHGSPAYDEDELGRAPEAGRRQADIVLSVALPLATETFAGSDPPPGRGCNATLAPQGAAGIPLSPGVTRIEVDPGPTVALGLRRFAVGDFPVPTRELPGDSVMLLTIPRDASPRPWHLQVTAQQQVAVCESRGA